MWLAALATGVAASGRAPRVAVSLVAVCVTGPYLFYRPYDHWETLRFLLPALVVSTIAAAFGLLYVSRRVAGHAGGSLLAALIATAVAYTWVSWLSANNVFNMPEHEVRHRVVGELVARATPQDAVILALQHSGSVRYYADRDTLNWDHIPSGQFTASVQALQQRGLAVYS